MAEASPTRKTVSYLIIGKTGVGKTSLINSVAGQEIADEGDDLDIGTFNIESYQVTHQNVKIQFWDTPGLFDMTRRSDEYIDKIREKYEKCDLVLYCSDMTDTRVTEQDRQTINTFTRNLGAAFWQRTCFVLTFANEVADPRARKTTSEYFTMRKQRLQDAYCKVIKESGVSNAVVEKIPFIPAGYHPWSLEKEQYILLDGKQWISVFWINCFSRVIDSQEAPRTVPSRQRLSTSESRKPVIRERATRDQCTFNKHNRDYLRQDWFECFTCWGGNSGFGCCWACALDCHRGHQLMRHHPPCAEGEGGFFCDCGMNKHQPAVCTFHSSKTKFCPQPFYRCYSCFTIDHAGVCHQCSINCHRGHNLAYAGTTLAFCDCGMSYCKVNCRIPAPSK